jgi:hypothetical protein
MGKLYDRLLLNELSDWVVVAAYGTQQLLVALQHERDIEPERPGKVPDGPYTEYRPT